jgi:hypothetical protein
MDTLRSLPSRIRDLIGDLPIFEQGETRVAPYFVLTESAGGLPCRNRRASATGTFKTSTPPA